MPEQNELSWPRKAIYILLPFLVFSSALEAASRVVELFRGRTAPDIGWGFTGENRLFIPKAGASTTL